jgi:hypothetical protein
MNLLTGLLRQWLTQDVARTNAAQAAVRLKHRRRELDDLDAFLAAQRHDHPRAGGGLAPRATDTVHARRPRQRPQ